MLYGDIPPILKYLLQLCLDFAGIRSLNFSILSPGRRLKTLFIDHLGGVANSVQNVKRAVISILYFAKALSILR